MAATKKLHRKQRQRARTELKQNQKAITDTDFLLRTISIIFHLTKSENKNNKQEIKDNVFK